MEQGENIFNQAGYIQPANMSSYIITAIDNAIAYTKECMGISDASLGSIKPNNATAIIAVQKSAVVPLENVKSNLYKNDRRYGRNNTGDDCYLLWNKNSSSRWTTNGF